MLFFDDGKGITLHLTLSIFQENPLTQEFSGQDNFNTQGIGKDNSFAHKFSLYKKNIEENLCVKELILNLISYHIYQII